MQLRRPLTAALVVVALVTPAAASHAAPGPGRHSLSAHGATVANATAPGHGGSKNGHASKGGYHPTTGPTFNNPLGSGPVKYRVLNVVQRAIDHAPHGSLIRIMSWNIMSRSVVSKLLAAQRRGVRVLALMDDSNRTTIPNPDYRRLRYGLAAQNAKAAKGRKSHAKTCVKSCRGDSGEAHSKYFLFSKTGHRKHVLMEGSTNLTTAAAVNQWNDVFTFVGNDKLYKFAGHVFDQMWPDKPVPNPYREKVTPTVTMFFSPMKGKNYHGDRRLQLLNKVHCFHARGAGYDGHTIIRFAPDVLRNNRGMAVAERLRFLWNHGCSVKIGYTVMGRAIHSFLKQNVGRGPIPMKHLVQDFNGDGEFDNYFHLKVLSVNGHVGGDHSAYYVVNGSSNVSGFAAASDEQVAIIHRKNATLAYQGYIDYWYDNFPKSAPPPDGRRLVGVNPYAHVDMD